MTAVLSVTGPSLLVRDTLNAVLVFPAVCLLKRNVPPASPFSPLPPGTPIPDIPGIKNHKEY